MGKNKKELPSFVENVIGHCLNCKRVPMKEILENPETLTEQQMNRYRDQAGCRGCKAFGRAEGIYKFDAILTSLHLRQQFIHSGKGKTATYTKRYGKTVSELRKEGKSIAKISETTGISTKSVQKIMKDLNLK